MVAPARRRGVAGATRARAPAPLAPGSRPDASGVEAGGVFAQERRRRGRRFLAPSERRRRFDS
jgi:hypothetical protein